MTKQEKALKQVFKAANASVYRLSLHSGVALIIDTRSHSACSQSLRVARVLGFRITHKAQRLTLFTKTDKAIMGYRFLARIEDPEKMIANAKIIMNSTQHPDVVMEALFLSN